MCSACMTISPRGSNSAVEASRRSLMFGGVGGADQDRAHLLAHGAQRAGQHLELDRVDAGFAHEDRVMRDSLMRIG